MKNDGELPKPNSPRTKLASEHDDILFDLLIDRDDSDLPLDYRRTHGPFELIRIAALGLDSMIEEMADTIVLTTGVVVVSTASTKLNLILEGDLGLTDVQRNAVEKELETVEQVAPRAKRMIADDFAKLNAITLIGLCAAVESGIKDTILMALRFWPGRISRLRSLDIPELESFSDDGLSYADAQSVHTTLERWCYKKSKTPMGRRLKMLDAVDLGISVDDDVVRDANEMIYVRNCILHYRSRADHRAPQPPTRTPFKKGREFRVTRTAMASYFMAAHAIGGALAEAGLLKKGTP